MKRKEKQEKFSRMFTVGALTMSMTISPLSVSNIKASVQVIDITNTITCACEWMQEQVLPNAQEWAEQVTVLLDRAPDDLAEQELDAKDKAYAKTVRTKVVVFAISL